MITKEQAVILQRLIYKLTSAREHLGSIEGSYGWNEAYSPVEAAEKALQEFIKSITEGA